MRLMCQLCVRCCCVLIQLLFSDTNSATHGHRLSDRRRKKDGERGRRGGERMKDKEDKRKVEVEKTGRGGKRGLRQRRESEDKEVHL